MTRTKFSNGKKAMTRTKKPVKWNKDRCQQAFDFAFLGATDEQIAERMDVNIHTINYWKRTKPEFRKMLDKGRHQANAKVARSLYEVAVGYSHPDVTILANRVKVYNEAGRVIEEHTEPLIVPYTKYYKPESFACLKILAIKERELWADILKVQTTSDININVKKIDYANFSDEDLLALENMGMKQLQIPQDGSRSN